MENTKKEQQEALETLVEFNERLLKNMKIIVKELSGKRLDDTDKFLKAIVDAMNSISVCERVFAYCSVGITENGENITCIK